MKQILLMIAVVALVGCSSIGTPIWEFTTGSYVFSPAIGSDGTVYVGSWDNKLYAIKTSSKGLAKSPWSMRGQNARHTGRTNRPTPYSSLVSPNNPPCVRTW